MQPYIDSAMRKVVAQATAHTNPIWESSLIAGLHRTVMQIIIFWETDA